MKVYEAKYIIYEDFYGDLCEPACDGFVFIDFEEAREYVSEILEGWLISNEYRAKDEAENETEGETDDEAEDEESKEYKDIDDVYCDFQIIEKDTKDEDFEVEWKLGLDGEVLWKYKMIEGIGYQEFPGDDLQEAGTKFPVGAYVVKKGELERAARSPFHNDKAEIFVVGMQPRNKAELTEEKRVRWENHYYLVGIGDYGGWYHINAPENDLELFTREIPIGFQILRKIYTGEAPNSEKYKDMLMTGELILPSVPTYREIKRS